MPKLETLLKSDLGKGLALGLGLGVLLPIAISVVTRSARPVLRSAVKSGILLMDAGRATLAVAGETLEDLVTEARGEMVEHKSGSAVDAHPTPDGGDTT